MAEKKDKELKKEATKVAPKKETKKTEAKTTAKKTAPKKTEAKKETKTTKKAEVKKETKTTKKAEVKKETKTTKKAEAKKEEKTEVKDQKVVEAKAFLRYERISPSKVIIVARLIRGKDVDEALTILKFTSKAASPILTKLINSAVANAENNHHMDRNKLYISEIMVNVGPILKRIRPRARGSASRINKRTSHIEVVLRERE